MKFLILSRLPEIHSTRRLVQEVMAANHEIFVEHPDTNYSALEGDILIPRLGNFRYEEAIQRLARFAEKKPKLRILNPPAAFHNARHKKQALLTLKDLPQPKLYDEAGNFPVVVKDCLSSQGEGVFLCHSPAELEACLVKLQGREILFQEYIAESSGHDIRAFVVGARVVASMERVAENPEKEFRSNLALGGHALPTTLSEEERDLCRMAVQKLRLDYAGVDFVRSRRGPLLLEVNPCPGFEGIEKCTGLNIAKEVVLHAESLFCSNS